MKQHTQLKPVHQLLGFHIRGPYPLTQEAADTCGRLLVHRSAEILGAMSGAGLERLLKEALNEKSTKSY